MSLFNNTHKSFNGWPDFNEDEVVLCSAYCQLTDLVIPRIGFGLEKGPKMLQENSDFKILNPNIVLKRNTPNTLTRLHLCFNQKKKTISKSRFKSTLKINTKMVKR